MGIEKFLEPKSIAVVGASNTEGKVGCILMKKLLQFKGEVIPINLKHDFIFGKKVYSSLEKYTDRIDLVLIATPAKTVAGILKECGRKKIKNVIVISAGFSEVGNAKAEKEISEICRRYGIRFLGPNCFGVANPYFNLDTTFASSSAKKGSTAFISQSGALWSYISEIDEGFSGFVSLGNMGDLSFVDFVEYFEKDKRTKKIVLYVEKLKEGRRFIEVCKKSKKKIIVVKVGKSKEGSKAAFSHTGSLATDFEIYRGAFRQCRVEAVDSIYSALKPNSKVESFPRAGKKNKVFIVTNAGGAGALISDLCKENRWELVSAENFKVNPLDVLGTAGPEDYEKVLKKLETKNFYDFVFVVLTPQEMSEPERVAEKVVEFAKKKKVIAFFLGGKSVEGAVKIFKKNNIRVLTECC